jgi:hypothetical protein
MSTGACLWVFSPSIGPTNRANYPRLSADGALERGDRVSPKAEQRVVDAGPERVSIFAHQLEMRRPIRRGDQCGAVGYGESGGRDEPVSEER